MQTQLLPTYAVRQRKAEPSAQDVIVPLAQSLVKGGEKLLVLRNTRGPAEGCANYLSKDLGLPPAADAIAALSIHDISSSGERLRQCLSGGTAFHNSNLTRDERVVIERHFRDPKKAASRFLADNHHARCRDQYAGVNCDLGRTRVHRGGWAPVHSC